MKVTLLTLSLTLIIVFSACSSTSSTIKKEPTSHQNENNHTIIIDVDEELSLHESLDELRDQKSIILDTPIYIGDNDEVSFIGESIEKNSPLSIQYGKQKTIKFTGKTFIIKSMELKNGDNIRVKDKDGNLFIDMKVVTKK